ncbi:surface antigen [Streptomyces sp. CG 926]|nr:surface antigen [Streptomyces sp. CG 926]
MTVLPSGIPPLRDRRLPVARHVLRRVVSVLVTVLLTSLFSAAAVPSASALSDDYPAKWRNVPMDSVSDDWGMFNRECTSFVAWRLQSRNGFGMPFHADATDWGNRARALGFHVDNIPAKGAVALGVGHVAWVESVGNGTVTIEEYNHGYDGTYNARTVPTGAFQYIHFKDLADVPPPPQSAPAAPAGIAVLAHGSRVVLQWSASAGATDYQVSRNGTLLATVTGTRWLDVQVSPHQDYAYSVVARNAAGVSAAATRYVQNDADSADLAYLSTKDGPAECGRAGDQGAQKLVCSVLKPTGWVTAYSVPNDWGYASDRSWLANADGSVSYCRRVGAGDQVLCDRFDGSTWTSSMSPHFDLGYHENRAYLSTKDGPAVCGRAGDQGSQGLVCSVLKPTGWVTAYSVPNDWGYASDRSWLANADGSVSYCRRVGAGDQVLCDRFDGSAWTSSMSPHYDLGYPDTFA